MAQRNGNGGTLIIIIILLLAVLFGLYRCYGDKLKPASQSSASSSAASAETSAFDDMSSPELSAASSASASAEPEAADGFSYMPATDLIPRSITSNGAVPVYTAYANLTNWGPDMCFPTEDRAFANSQVFSSGGSKYPTIGATSNGPQCASENYAYPWRDNFCEYRGVSTGTKNVLCHSGYGHQGQDIRPETCKPDLHWAIAAETGKIKAVGGYSIEIRSATSPNRVYRYLHLHPSYKQHWKVGMDVQKGQKLGLISNYGQLADGTIAPYTTYHLHFEMRLNVATVIDGQQRAALAFLPPYTALVSSYQRKLAGNGCTVSDWGPPLP